MSSTAATCIIGDIHGSLSPLKELLPQVEHRAETIIFLGDYIDRGPASKEVVDYILAFKARRKGVIALMGNHEFMLLNYLKGYDTTVFLRVGGRQTLASYSIRPENGFEEAHRQFPEEHLSFFNQLPLLWENQHGIYVHAGLEPAVHLSRQSRDWCLWARDAFIHSSHNFGKPVVFGHTVFPEPLVRKNKIGIDTGSVYGQTLTALLLPDMEFISVPGEREHPYPFP